MEEYAGRILADRYRLPLPPADEYEPVETRAFDTRSGQEVLVRQVPLPEVVDAEMLDGHRAPAAGRRSPADLPAVRRAIEAAQAAAAVPDHPRLDQVFDVFAEGGSLWIVSELVPSRPLAALIADELLTPYRAAEVASDVLTALRVLHAHGWTHRNITVRTVLVCDDGRVVLTGLAAGAAEDALCGYDPVPRPDPAEDGAGGWDGPDPGADPGARGYAPGQQPPYAPPTSGHEPHLARPAHPGDGGPAPRQLSGPPEQAPRPRSVPGPADAPLVAPGYDTGPRYRDHITPDRPAPRPDHTEAPRPDHTEAARPELPGARPELPGARPGVPPGGPLDLDAAARAGAVAAYRAGARAAAARVSEERRAGAAPVPEPRPQGSTLPQGYAYPYGGPRPESGASWHGATPRQALPPARQSGPPQEAQPDGAPGRALPPAQPPHRAPAPAGGPQHAEQAAPPAPASAAAQPEPRSGAWPGLPAQLALPQGYRQAEAAGAAGTPAGERAAEPFDRPAPRPGGQPFDAGWGGGPRTGLDAERARQTRMAVVGAVTERWAPEQARSVAGPWQLAAPVGPATDLWALGALLYRAVQGHAPYPEDSVAELVELVCSEPPAFAEECGALRPVVESLLRQDPTERPDFEELRGWLRSLVRSAPEPDTGFAALPMPEPDPARLPVVRRRGELHGRHRNPAAPRKPRSLGVTLLVGILVLLAGAVAYAMLFMPRSPSGGSDGAAATPSPKSSPSASASGAGGATPSGTPESKPAPQTTTPPAGPAVSAPAGYGNQQDPEHFEVAVPDGWERRGINEAGQVRYTDGQFVLTVVPGRDKVAGNPDPAAYQKDKEQELTPYRTSTWSTVSEVKSTKVGQQLRATGKYTWIDGTGRSVVARNFVVALGGSYHVVIVTGPQDEESKVTEVFEKATASYRAGG
ncbi:serine/threonine protein kinase [Streptomyces sp. cmx-4-9]|uniref:serine/threonine protein kinase n=1 Tax=Streptomyces sp. cmx-4-9 TaxID=2790941 RepID=UPI00397FA1EF